MIHLDLSTDEERLLAEILQDDLSDLRMEIADTDRGEYRALLKHRKEVLAKVLAALPGSYAAEPKPGSTI